MFFIGFVVDKDYLTILQKSKKKRKDYRNGIKKSNLKGNCTNQKVDFR